MPLSRRKDCQMRQTNKEPEWSSICNNVFDQYLDTADLFPLGEDRSSSIDSGNPYGFSGSSEQSHQTDATSPDPAPDHSAQDAVLEAKQPKAKEPAGFWTKTLRALEQNAADSERRQRLRSAKSHPDFLSLGGCPTPPTAHLSPADQSFSAQRQVSRSAANGRRHASTARSLSRGRPVGVAKATVGGSVNPHATIRKCSASPPKMMTPSRYRSGFKDVWTEKARAAPGRFELRVPSMGLPVSPPPSARMPHGAGFDAAFGGSPAIYPPLPAYDEQLSPLANTFQQAHIHTPISSPNINALAFANNALPQFEPLPPVSNPYAAQTFPLHDTSPLFPEPSSSLAGSKLHSFDFGFSSSPDATAFTAPFDVIKPAYYTCGHLPPQDGFGGLRETILPSTETGSAATAGLGISFNPSLVSPYISVPDTAALPSWGHHPATSFPDIYHAPARHHGAPVTPRHHRSKSRLRSQSPSPPVTEPRSRKAASSSRRISQHRRAKSASATPRHHQDKSGFVNFTPQDSNKLLSGVAPSGSSKTKARREKEAAEKRRRLSQAAVKAVVEAGGDLDALSKAGLLA